MLLSDKRIPKALFSLRGCAGWSAPLLFAHPEDRFSRVEALLRDISTNDVYVLPELYKSTTGCEDKYLMSDYY